MMTMVDGEIHQVYLDAIKNLVGFFGGHGYQRMFLDVVKFVVKYVMCRCTPLKTNISPED